MVSTGDTDLVSTYDLPDSERLPGGGWGWGYSGVNFGHLKWGAGYSGVNFGHLKSEVFHWGGGGGWRLTSKPLGLWQSSHFERYFELHI